MWGFWAKQIGTPIITAVGLTGNTLSFLVMGCSQRLRKRSYSQFLCLLAIFDSLNLIINEIDLCKCTYTSLLSPLPPWSWPYMWNQSMTGVSIRVLLVYWNYARYQYEANTNWRHSIVRMPSSGQTMICFWEVVLWRLHVRHL